MALSLADIEAEARRRFGSYVDVMIAGSRLSVVHPSGMSAELEMTRAARLLSIEQFGERYLAGPIAALRKIVPV